MNYLAALILATAAGPIDGPETCDLKDTVYLTVTAKDLKKESIICIPENKDWRLMKDFDGSPIIVFNPKVAGTYYFIVSINNVPTTFKITVGQLPIPPPGPNPQPDPNGFLSAFVKDGSNQEQLQRLVQVYTACASNTFATNGDLINYLVANAKGITLINLKAAVKAYLETRLNVNIEDKLDPNVQTTFAQLVKDLAVLKGAK